ncbi:MAG: 4-carboxymuconolactone decarboxylase [Pseudomonadota bacterium]
MTEDRSAEAQYEAGMKTRREVLGDGYVDGAEARKTALDADFQRLIAQNAWGAVWSRPTLERRERSLLTLVILAALGNWEEFTLHARAAANTGATPEDVAEALMHVAIYAGVPRANHAMKIVKELYG